MFKVVFTLSIKAVRAECDSPRLVIPFTATMTSHSCRPIASALLAGRICDEQWMNNNERHTIHYKQCAKNNDEHQ